MRLMIPFVLALGLSLATASQAATATPRPVAATALAVGDMSLGSPKARVRVDEYASLSCPHCARFSNEVFPAFKAKYIDSGKVRFTLHEMITPPAALAVAGFLTARCAGPAGYFPMVEALFRRQDEIFKAGELRTVLLDVAAASGLSEAQVMACVEDESARKALDARVESALAQGVNATPTFFIDGVKVAEGEMSLFDLDKAIATAAKSKGPPARP